MKHRRHIHIGELLLHLGLVHVDQLQETLEYQKTHRPKQKLGELLLDRGLIDEAALIRTIYKQSQQIDPPGKRSGGKFAALIIYGLLRHEELEAFVKQAEREKSAVETVLMKQKRLTKQQLGAALSAYYQCPFKEYDEKLLIAPECVNEIQPKLFKDQLLDPAARHR